MQWSLDATTTKWLDRAEEEVWRRLLATKSLLVDQLDRELQTAHQLGLGDYEVLVHLSEAPAPLRMTELARQVRLSPSGLTRRMDGLVQRGLVQRVACESDGRGSYASLTDAGLTALRQAAPTHVRGVMRYLIEPLGPDGVAALAAGLAAISRALEAGE